MAFFNQDECKSFTIEPKGTYFSPIMRNLCSAVETAHLPKQIHNVPRILENYVRNVYFGKGVEQGPEIVEGKQEFVKRDFTRKEEVILGFSGGKDSTAAALICKEKGLTPILYYVIGANKSYPGEHERAREVAKELNFDLVEARIKWGNGSQYKEHPMKDQLILAMMLDFGLERGITQYTMGVEQTNVQSQSNINYNWSDSVEMFNDWNVWPKSLIPEYSWFWCVEHLSQSIDVLCQHSIELLGKTTSCLTPHRFQRMRREQTENEFKIELLPHRCGVCWKCCAEYLNLVALDKVQIKRKFVKKCFQKYKKDLPTVFGNRFLEGESDYEILKSAVNPKFISTGILEDILFEKAQ